MKRIVVALATVVVCSGLGVSSALAQTDAIVIGLVLLLAAADRKRRTTVPAQPR